MFVGHYSASFALKAAKPQIPLWVLFLAAQAVDIGWNVLVLLGVEKARYVPGFTVAFPFDLYFMPYTHSLVAGLIWGAAAGVAYFLWRKQHGVAAAAAVAAAVLSHWFLDLPLHPPDLPLYGDSLKQGWGWWNYPVPALLLEVGLLAAATGLYARTCPQFARRAWIFCGVLALIQAGQNLGPWLLTSTEAVAVAAFAAYLAFAFVAYRIERLSRA